jgi:hypothetical protein
MAVEIITTVLVAATANAPAGPYDLTDLATAHDELDLPMSDTSKDAFLSRAITQDSALIANYCNRVFAVEAVQDQIFLRQGWQGFALNPYVPLQLSRWPLVNSTPVSLTGDTHGTTTVDNLSSTAGLVQGALFFGPGILPGTKINAIVGASVTLSQAATATAAGVSFTTGLQVVQTTNVATTPVTTTTLTYGTDFTIDAKRGTLSRLDAYTGNPVRWESYPVTVQYQAGYAAIPDDLKIATLRLITARYKSRNRDPFLRTEGEPGIGQSTYWVGTLPGQTGSLPPEVEAICDRYRVPSV